MKTNLTNFMLMLDFKIKLFNFLSVSPNIILILVVRHKTHFLLQKYHGIYITWCNFDMIIH